MRIWAMKKQTQNKPNFKPGDGFSPQVRLSAWGRLTVGTPYGGVLRTVENNEY